MSVRDDGDLKSTQTVEAAGVARADAMQVLWGRNGRKILWAGIVCMLIAYQFDNALLYNYRNYAASAFNNVAGLATLATAGNIVFAVFKPPIAKTSDVIGRREAYVFCICCYLLGYFLCASSSSFGVYAGGFVFANIGQTGANILNDMFLILIIETIIIVGCQIVVPRVEQAQVTTLVLLCVFLGASVGTAAAGGIYSGSFREELLKQLDPEVANSVYESITSAVIPEVGSAAREAANIAYSDVLRSIIYVAVATSALCVVLALLLPNHRLRDGKTLVTGVERTELSAWRMKGAAQV